MSKAVTKGAHWMPRMAQYSLHGQRNGRVDILPANARMPTFLELEERYNRYKTEYRDAQAVVEELKKDLETDAEYKRYMQFFHANKHKQYVAMPSKFAKKLDRLQEARDRMCGLAAKCQDFKVIFGEARDVRYERLWIETATAMLPWDVVSQIESVVSQNLRNKDVL